MERDAAISGSQRCVLAGTPPSPAERTTARFAGESPVGADNCRYRALTGWTMTARRVGTTWAGARWAGLALLSVALAGAASSPGGPGGSDAGSGGGGGGGGGGSDGGLPQQLCGPMDVAFVVDVTGSMQPPIDNVKAAIP